MKAAKLVGLALIAITLFLSGSAFAADNPKGTASGIFDAWANKIRTVYEDTVKIQATRYDYANHTKLKDTIKNETKKLGTDLGAKVKCDQQLTEDLRKFLENKGTELTKYIIVNPNTSRFTCLVNGQLIAVVNVEMK